MSHYYTSCANLTIGSLRSAAPKLVHESNSEGGTPLATPICAKFGNISDLPDGTFGMPTGLDRFTRAEYSHLDMRLERGHDCPSAPRIDSGIFDYDFALEQKTSLGLDILVDSGVDDFMGECSHEFNGVQTHLRHSHGSENYKYPKVEARQEETEPAYKGTNAPEDHCGIWTAPRAPRPDTGSWSSSTENVAPITHWRLNLEKKRALHPRPQLGHITPSASVESNQSKHIDLNTKAKPAKRLTPDDAPIRTVKWNLGLGLTLDDIAEPDGCGTSVGELSMELTEDSFSDLDTDSGYCSTADTTLNTTTETIPDMARPCLNSPLGPVIHASASELRITPQARILSFQDHHKNVKRPRAQNPTKSAPKTQLAYTSGFPSEMDVACLIGRLRMNEYEGFRGLSNGALKFVAGEHSLNEAQGKAEHRVADAPIFTLLPPIEL